MPRPLCCSRSSAANRRPTSASGNEATSQREIGRARHGARPDRIIERGAEHPDHGGVGAACRRLRQRTPAKAVPEGQHAVNQEQPGKESSLERDRSPRQPVRLRANNRAQIRRECEQRTRHGLRDTIAGKEGLIVGPARVDHLRLQQGEHDMASSEDQRPGPIERIEQGNALLWINEKQGRRGDQQHREEDERDDALHARYRKTQLARQRPGRLATHQESEPGAKGNRADLGRGPAGECHQRHGEKGDSCACAVGGEGARHPPDRLSDDRHGDELEAMKDSLRRRPLECPGGEGETEQDERRGQREPVPRGKPAKQAAAQHAKRKPTWLDAGSGRNWQSATRSP